MGWVIPWPILLLVKKLQSMTLPSSKNPMMISNLSLKRFAFFSLSLILTCLFNGCGGGESTVSVLPDKTYPVKGKVLMADGKPLTEGTINFVPTDFTKGRLATGKIESDGSFTLKSGPSQDGAAEGEYKVSVESTKGTPTGKPGVTKSIVPVRFNDETTSGLTATVKPQDNDVPPFVLDLSKVKAPASATRGNARDRG
jgi:hypothetical protein